MAERLAAVDARRGRLIVTSWSETEIGLWSLNGWFRILDATAEDAALGRAVAGALEQSRVGAPDEDAFDALRRAVRARSHSDYVRGTRNVSVELLRRQIGRLPLRRRFEEVVKVEPMRNEGPRNGFSPLPEGAIELSAPSDEQLGGAVQTALATAIPYGSEVGAEAPAADTERPAAARGFGPRSAWLAVRCDDAREVASALGLREVRPAGWERALEAVRERAEKRPLVLVTPPVDGWTLVVHSYLTEQIDLGTLSRRFGEAHSFASHRVTELQEWQCWVGVSPVRRYRWVGESGEIQLDEGTPAAAEAGIARRADLDGDWDELVFPDEGVVLNVAAEWSLDPTSLDHRVDVPAEGLVGRLESS